MLLKLLFRLISHFYFSSLQKRKEERIINLEFYDAIYFFSLARLMSDNSVMTAQERIFSGLLSKGNRENSGQVYSVLLKTRD
jgi:hypothetical protein